MTRGDAQQKLNKKVLTKGTFERQLAETRKKIKQTIAVSHLQNYLRTNNLTLKIHLLFPMLKIGLFKYLGPR